MKYKQEKKLIFDIIKSYLYTTSPPNITTKELQVLNLLAKETNIEGIVYQVLKTTNLPVGSLQSLQERQQTIKHIDLIQAKLFAQLQKTTINFAPLCLTRTKQFKAYKKGNIYTKKIRCISFDTKESIAFTLHTQKFFLEQVEIFWEKTLRLQNKEAEKNPQELINLIAKRKHILHNKKKKTLLETQYQRMKFFSKNDSSTYIHNNGLDIEIQFQLKIKPSLLEIPLEQIQTMQKQKQQHISQEDALIINAALFIDSLRSKHKTKNSLSQIIALAYLLDEKKINWYRVIMQAKQHRCSSIVWFYLQLAKTHLTCNIPHQVLHQLKKDGSTLQNILLQHINGYHLLFEEKDAFVQLFSYLYLSKTIGQKITLWSHHIVAKIQQ